MHTKFVIFVIIGSLLVATMHSSSTLFVFAELLTSCENLNETKAHCTVTYGESYQLGSDCTKNPDGTYSCTQDQDKNNTDDGLSDKPDYLKNALTKGQGEITRGEEFLQDAEAKDDNNDDTSASTPNAPDPIPIPYPNNITKAQIATD